MRASTAPGILPSSRCRAGPTTLSGPAQAVRQCYMLRRDDTGPSGRPQAITRSGGRVALGRGVDVGLVAVDVDALLTARVPAGTHHEPHQAHEEQHDRGPDVEPEAEDVVQL